GPAAIRAAPRMPGDTGPARDQSFLHARQLMLTTRSLSTYADGGRDGRPRLRDMGAAGAGPVAGEVRRCPRWLLLVDKGAAQLGVRLARVVEVPVHDGELCLPVGVERLHHG